MIMVEILMANKLSPLILHALDLSKAFDRANRDILFHKLNKLGLKGKLWKAILSTYSHSITQILIGALRSKPFQLPNGIKPGSVLSTLLFIPPHPTRSAPQTLPPASMVTTTQPRALLVI